MEIKAIQCPNCGSTQKAEIRRNHFRCESCGSEYVLDDGKSTVLVQAAPAAAAPAKTRTTVFAIVGAALAVLIIIVVVGSSGSRNEYHSSTVPLVETLPDHRWSWRASFLFTTADRKPVLMSIG